jgi:hypothetical protein
LAKESAAGREPSGSWSVIILDNATLRATAMFTFVQNTQQKQQKLQRNFSPLRG